MFDVSGREITEGSIPRALLVLAAPLVAQNFAMVAQHVIDTFWLGRLGGDAVAAIGLVLPLSALLFIPMAAVYSGSQIVTAQGVGAGDEAAARRTPVQATLLGVAGAVLLIGVVSVAGDDAVALLGPSAVVARMGASYLLGQSYSLVPMSVSDSLESGLVGWGDSKLSLYVNLVAIGTNLLVDPFLIFGWGPFPAWGVYGAAIATGVGYTVGGLLALRFATGGHGTYAVSRECLEVEPVRLWRILRVGSPLAGKRSGQQVARVGMVAIVSAVGGTAALAAYSIGARVATVAFVPAAGLGQAATSMVGQNVGAGNSRRAVATTWTGVAVGVVGLAAVGAGQWMAPDLLARTFVPDIGGAALEYAVTYLRILALGYWAFGVIYVVEGGFNGTGRTAVSMAATLIQYWAVRLPVAAVGAFALGLGVVAAFWAVTVSNVVAAVGLAAYYHRLSAAGSLEPAAEGVATD